MSSELAGTETVETNNAKIGPNLASKNKWFEPGLLSLLLLIGLALRLFNLNRTSLWWNEVNGIGAVQNRSFGEALGSFDKYILHPTLFRGILQIWISLVGIGEPVRLFSALAGVATLAVVYYIGRGWLGQRTAFTVLALLTISPLLLYWSQNIEVYAFFILLVAISMLLVLQVNEYPPQNWRWAIYGVSAAALIYTDYLGFYVILSQLVFLGITLFKNRANLLRALLTFGLVGLAYLPWLGNLREHFRMSREFYAFIPVRWGISQILEALNYQLFWFVPKSLGFVAGGIFFPLYGLGLIWLWQNSRKLAILLSCWSWLPLLLIWLGGRLRLDFLAQTSQLAFCTPGFLLVVAAGIWALQDWLKFAPYVALGLALLISGLAYLNYSQNYWQQEWRGLVGEVRGQQQAGDTILLLNPQNLTAPTFDYYYLLGAGANNTLERRSLDLYQDAPSQIRDVFKDKKRVWVVSWYTGNSDFENARKTLESNLPSGYSVASYKEYQSSQQGLLGLTLYANKSN